MKITVFSDIRLVLEDQINDYYRRFYAGQSIVHMVSMNYMEQGLRELGLFPEPPPKVIPYSEYTYFADMSKAFARIVSVFWNQRQIAPPPKATRNSGRPIRNRRHDDSSSSDDEEPTHRATKRINEKSNAQRDATSAR